MTDQDPNAPWVPENARPFLVGDRVRVRLSGECRHPKWKENGKVKRGHVAEEDGRVGRIEFFFQGVPSDGGHLMFVLYDEAIRWHEYSVVGTGYAAIELEHLDELPS